ncbi:autotransporter domain-containing protein [Bradyrhizobium sp. WBAH42]|nr:autotransporter domain-containing protein [Bradyrhizobium sp. WBAH30]MDD1545317.1 autotransporter domain-containing protein [Bradyrhizobium sp. WBAH41]MDD1558542.1 autotransporter domain-containing protein [Bradyrhizobium sp. WBAH23]MDD1566467.1 autotransporter domain-containing protein [Bradyrhizobium sp. WBAH33]MDD1593801.1 autotransporter domain-containing protein [Bradyrhizobium sp. WBAH42]NRB91386.1 autotransporter domain-containing protein [Bradyrhizobium sp. WBAH10]QCJ93821.1 autotr
MGAIALVSPVQAQQVFNGSQTTPNGAVNGGGGVWDNTTTNWTDAVGSVSTTYDPASVGTLFGSSGPSIPATGGTVTVTPGGVQLTGLVGFDLTADGSVYTIQGGDLRLASGGTTFVTNDVTGTSDPSAIIVSRIVGSGGINVQGSGTLALLGANTYAGGTFICNCGSLQLGDATHTASIVGAVTNEGLFSVVNADTSGITSIQNAFSGTTLFLNASSASSIAITNSGQLYFGDPNGGGSDTATAGRATIVNDGGLVGFFGRTNAGTANITNQNGGGIAFLEQASAGSATIVNKDFSGTIFGSLAGSDTASAGNATIINEADGLTNFGAFTTAGNATIITKDGGKTEFFDNATGGNARFITTGTGIVDFGVSIGPNGDGRITAGSIEGSGFYYIGGGNTLAVGSNNRSTEVSGVIGDYDPCGCGPIGPGSLEKVGSGTLILSGANTYTGSTNVNGGILRVDGDISPSSLTTVNSGGALFGAGRVGNTVIASGGIYAPGDGGPGSSMQVQGHLAFQSGSVYVVQVGSGSSTSHARVSGNVVLNGTVGVALYPGAAVMKHYSIMQFFGSSSDNFSGVAAPGGLIGTTTVGSNEVFLDFALDYGAKYALNVNQKNVATTLQNFFNSNGFLQAEFAGLGPNGLTQASGEPATGAQQTTFNAMNLFLGLLTDVFSSGRSGTPGATPFAPDAQARGKKTRDAFAAIDRKAPAATFEQRWDVWAAGYGGSQTTDGNAGLGSNNTTSSVYGTAVGLDYRFSPSTIAGFALAGGGTGFNVSGLGWGRSDLFQAGAFLRHTAGPAYVTAALAYGWQDVTTNRVVTAAGYDQLRAQFNANAVSGRIEGGYRYAMQWAGVTPYAALQATLFSLPAYAESAVVGSNVFALNYAAKDVTSTRSELGLRADRSFAAAGGLMTLRGRLAWAHDYNPDRTVGAVFQTLPGSAFVVNGAAQARDSALTTASVQMNWMNGWSASATFEGEFSNLTRSYAGKGLVRYAW